MRHKELEAAPRLLVEAKLEPLQGSRFQPTGFPDIGPAEYTAPNGTEMLLVESAQSMANHLESVTWDAAKGDLVASLQGLPYVRVKLPDGRITSSILEAHRLNSPYILKGANGLGALPELAELEKDPSNVRRLAKTVFKYDPNSVLHGVFLEKIGGGLRLRRLLSAFVEAREVNAADSGGLKADQVDPTGKLGGGAAEGYGHVPFHRREFTAKDIRAYVNLDLAQLRAYGLGEPAEDLLVTLALWKVGRFLREGLRLRTACDLRLSDGLHVTQPRDWKVPELKDLEAALPGLVRACKPLFTNPPVTELAWSPPKKGDKKGKVKEAKGEDEDAEEAES